MNGSCAPDIRHGYQSGTSQRTVQVHGLNLGQQQQTEAHQPTVHLQGSSTAWLARLELLAVQPACLKAHPETPLQPGQAAAWQQLQHDILLHLEATLLADAELPAAAVDTAAAAASIDEATVAFQCPEMATASAAAPALPAPVQLQDAELEMIVLTRQMQLLQQQRLSLLQLVLQQQQQQEEDQGALQPAHSSSRPGDESSSSSSSMHFLPSPSPPAKCISTQNRSHKDLPPALHSLPTGGVQHPACMCQHARHTHHQPPTERTYENVAGGTAQVPVNLVHVCPFLTFP